MPILILKMIPHLALSSKCDRRDVSGSVYIIRSALNISAVPVAHADSPCWPQ